MKNKILDFNMKSMKSVKKETVVHNTPMKKVTVVAKEEVSLTLTFKKLNYANKFV